jgi:three-Cys-motif partner protein
MHEMSEDYHGREQTGLKHRVLQEYLAAWAHKLGSTRTQHLWYVDVFAGPWESQDERRSDTSIAIGLQKLNDAARTWSSMGHQVKLHAVFVERSPAAYRALCAYVADAAEAVDVHTLHGTFGDHAGAIDKLIGPQPAFIFVDPTGWDGVAMQHIATLARRDRRDVMINVMYDHINRFKDDERTFLREQMRAFFGLTDNDLPPGLTEEQLLKVYRDRLKLAAGVRWVADLAVPFPTRDRTKFRLVVASHHPLAIKLFRDIEAKVIGREASPARDGARAREAASRTPQMALLRAPSAPLDQRYKEQHELAEAAVREFLPKLLAREGRTPFGELWPRILCTCHLTLSDLRRVVVNMEKSGLITVQGRGPREATVKDPHVLALPDRA